MDEILLKQLVRQVKILNVWISIFGTLLLAGFLILLFLVFKAATYIHDTSQRITTLQQQTQKSLDVKSQVCSNSSVSSLLGSSVCK